MTENSAPTGDQGSAPSRIVVVGASLAGGSAAVALRDQGFRGEVVLIGEETHQPYERPPLSKALLLGETDEPDWVADGTDFAARDITVLTGTTVTRIDAERHVVVDAGGTEHPYDKLLLATGSTPRRIDVPGADLPGVHYLRTLDDALALRSALTEGARVVVVGAGWIGCEVAAAARQRKAEVTVLDPLAQPLLRVLGDEIGAVFGALHREHGVDLRTGAGIAAVLGEDSVTGVRLSGPEGVAGETVEADVVVVGVGVLPNVALAAAAGLEIADGGVAVDATLATSDPDIYAVGDIAAHDHPHYPGRIRVEHWATAKDQGSHVAQNLLGAAEPYALRPFFFSDQYDLGCEYRGHADPARDRLVVRGDLQGREFIAFWLRDGSVAAAMNVNDWDHGDALQDLVDSGRQVSVEELTGGEL